MGLFFSKPTANVQTKEDLARITNDFIEKYLKYLMKCRVTKIPKIFQYHHLILCTENDGLVCYYSENGCIVALDTYSKESAYLSVFSKESLNYKCIVFNYALERLLNAHKIVSVNPNDYFSHMEIKSYHNYYKLDIDCIELNVLLKKRALELLDTCNALLLQGENHENVLKEKLNEINEKLQSENNIDKLKQLTAEGISTTDEIEKFNISNIQKEADNLKLFISMLVVPEIEPVTSNANA